MFIFFKFYLEIPVYYVFAFIGCYIIDKRFNIVKQTDFKEIAKQAIVICGVMTGIFSIPLFLFIGLQCFLHASIGFIIGMIGLYYLRYGHYHL